MPGKIIMKAKKSIFTHAAIFAVGAALAVVAQRPNADRTDESAASRSVRNSSSHSGHSSDAGSDSKPASARERREGAERSGRSNETSAVRLAEINSIADPLDRQSALMELINRLGPAEFAAVAEQYRNMDHFGNTRGEYEMILRGWAKADPLGALEYATNQPNSREQSSVILSAWAGNDAAAAERWALDHHEGDGPNPYLASVIRGIAAYDIAHASELAKSMPLSHERGDAMDAITHALFMQGAEAAMAWPATIQDPDMRGGYISMIADRLASKDPDKAAEWLASFPDAAAQNRGARRVAEALSREDVAQAAAWVKKLSPAAQAEAARGVIIPMSSKDIPGTAKWVSTLSGIPNFDRVVEEYVWSCDYRSPEQSAAWIQGIANEEQRTRLYHRMLGEWAKRDAGAVKNWVASNNVPGSVSKRFK